MKMTWHVVGLKHFALSYNNVSAQKKECIIFSSSLPDVRVFTFMAKDLKNMSV